MEQTTTILVVEDQDFLREALQVLLQNEGYRVLTASNGMEALHSLHEFSVDLILSDIMMPEMDGYAFYDVVRSRPEWVSIPFIFLTALGERDAVFASKRLGADDYLIKPIDSYELTTTVRSRLERSHQLMLVQLQQAYEASLIMLANAIELRDQYTRGHVERVMGLSVKIAEQMGWSAAQLQGLQYGSILHDIGKIYIRESILRKAGSLSPDEWAEMKRHTVIGADLLESVPFLANAISVIRYHHERWDGKGYPEGLAGEEIPLDARIVAVADSFDAMTSTRVYQRACSPHQALEEIKAGSRQRYDPQVVEALVAAWEQGLIDWPAEEHS
jgi:putative two-component system response regulator